MAVITLLDILTHPYRQTDGWILDLFPFSSNRDGKHPTLLPPAGAAIAVWAERSRCRWSELFPIIDAEVTSDVCPLFFRLGYPGALARMCADARLEVTRERRIAATLNFDGADAACDAAFLGGPVALAGSRFSDGEFLVVAARAVARREG